MTIGEVSISKKEFIERFQDNFDTFSKVAEYIKNTEGYFYCDNNTGILLLKSDGVPVDIELSEIKEQIKTLVYDLGFHSILNVYTDDENVEMRFNLINFEVNFGDTSAMGIEYRLPPETNQDNSFILYTPLDIENWYYYFIPPRG